MILAAEYAPVGEVAETNRILSSHRQHLRQHIPRKTISADHKKTEIDYSIQWQQNYILKSTYVLQHLQHIFKGSILKGNLKTLNQRHY